MRAKHNGRAPGAPDSYPLFDWLRFALASTVALSHEGIFTWDGSGNLAVQVFFSLSGWLIGGILLRTTHQELPRFFFNRCTRIWMPYFVAVAAVYGLSFVRDGASMGHLQFLFYDLTFTHNWFIPKTPEVIAAMPLGGTGAMFWSLAVEEQFYLAAPLLIVFAPWGKRLDVWVGVALLAYLSASWYGSVSLGVLGAVAKRDFGEWQSERWTRMGLIGAALVLFGALYRAPLLYSWLAPIFALCVVLATAQGGARGRLGIFLGGMSYPLYLNHWTGMFGANFIAKKLGILSMGLAPFAGYAIALLTGALAYVAIDQVIQRHRSRWFTKGRGRVLARAAYCLMGIGIVGGLLVRLRTGHL